MDINWLGCLTTVLVYSAPSGLLVTCLLDGCSFQILFTVQVEISIRLLVEFIPWIDENCER